MPASVCRVLRRLAWPHPPSLRWSPEICGGTDRYRALQVNPFPSPLAVAAAYGQGGWPGMASFGRGDRFPPRPCSGHGTNHRGPPHSVPPGQSDALIRDFGGARVSFGQRPKQHRRMRSRQSRFHPGRSAVRDLSFRLDQQSPAILCGAGHRPSASSTPWKQLALHILVLASQLGRVGEARWSGSPVRADARWGHPIPAAPTTVPLSGV